MSIAAETPIEHADQIELLPDPDPDTAPLAVPLLDAPEPELMDTLRDAARRALGRPAMDPLRRGAARGEPPRGQWLCGWNGRVHEWATYPLVLGGEPVPGAEADFPAVFDLLRELPETFRTVSFSRLSPRCAVPLHRTSSRPRLAWHLGLLVPAGGGCTLLAAGEPREHAEGLWLGFDQRRKHALMNTGREGDLVTLHCET